MHGSCSAEQSRVIASLVSPPYARSWMTRVSSPSLLSPFHNVILPFPQPPRLPSTNLPPPLCHSRTSFGTALFWFTFRLSAHFPPLPTFLSLSLSSSFFCESSLLRIKTPCNGTPHRAYGLGYDTFRANFRRNAARRDVLPQSETQLTRNTPAPGQPCAAIYRKSVKLLT